MDPADVPRRSGNRAGRIAAAAFASLLSLASAYGLAREMHHRATLASKQQPTREDWFETPTLTSPALIAQGRTAFLASCAHCHGVDASGDEGPDLHGLEGSDRYILNTILRGVRGEMPSFKKKLRSDDLAKLTAYIRSLK
jgi:mono/diheme cytochrome c family protein